jgi:hypothetical protein
VESFPENGKCVDLGFQLVAKEKRVPGFIRQINILKDNFFEQCQFDPANCKIGFMTRNNGICDQTNHFSLNEGTLESKVYQGQRQHKNRKGNKCYFQGFFDIFVLLIFNTTN